MQNQHPDKSVVTIEMFFLCQTGAYAKLISSQYGVGICCVKFVILL